MSGVAHRLRFAIDRLGCCIQTKWDLFHRCVNDCKHSLAKACKGVFLQAQMHSAYVWALAYRPFNSGAYMESKTRLLEVMLARENAWTCPLFESLWQEIRDDMGLPSTTTRDGVWESLASCPTFFRKGGIAKQGRWFSWNDVAEEQMAEFHALKLVLGYHYGSQKLDPDLAEEQKTLSSCVNQAKKGGGDVQSLRREFSKMKENLGGGPKLSYYCMSEKLWVHCCLIQLATRPVWTWYSLSVKNVKNADDSLVNSMHLQSEWSTDFHLQSIAGIPTSKDPVLVRLLNHEKFATEVPDKLMSLICHLLKKRCFSMSKHSAPPDCYSQLLADDNVAFHVEVEVRIPVVPF